MREVFRADGGGFRPPGYLHKPVAGIDADHDAFGTMPLDEPVHRLRIGHGAGTENNAGGSGIEDRSHIFIRTKAATHFERDRKCGSQFTEHRQMNRMTLKSAIQIHDVQKKPAPVLPGERLFDGCRTIDRFFLRLSL